MSSRELMETGVDVVCEEGAYGHGGSNDAWGDGLNWG